MKSKGQVNKLGRLKNTFRFTLIAGLIGFMIAIQFQTVKKPIERDTRDIWQLREAMLKESELQSNLLTEIRSNEQKLLAYESNHEKNKEQILKDTLQELKKEAGLTEIAGPGLILKIEPVYEEIQLGRPAVKSIPPELLNRLLNEINMYGAKYVSVDGKRVVNTTVIRDINTETKIDGASLGSLPIEVRVAVDDMKTAEKLYNRMQVSKVAEEFFIEDLRLTIGQPNVAVKIPAFDNPIHVRFMEAVKEGGNS